MENENATLYVRKKKRWNNMIKNILNTIGAIYIATAIAACSEGKDVDQTVDKRETVQALNKTTGTVATISISELSEAWLRCPKKGICTKETAEENEAVTRNQTNQQQTSDNSSDSPRDNDKPIVPCDDGLPEVDSRGRIVGCSTPDNNHPDTPEPRSSIDHPYFSCEDIQPLSGEKLDDRCLTIQKEYADAVFNAKRCRPELEGYTTLTREGDELPKQCTESVRERLGGCHDYVKTIITTTPPPPVLDKTHKDSLERQWECLQCKSMSLRGRPEYSFFCTQHVEDSPTAKDFTCREPVGDEPPVDSVGKPDQLPTKDEDRVALPTGMCLRKLRRMIQD